MSENENKPKIGAGHASAMFRLGLAELRAAATFEPTSVAQPAEYGLYGTATPQEIVKEKEVAASRPDEQPSILEERMKPSGGERESQERERPEQERE